MCFVTKPGALQHLKEFLNQSYINMDKLTIELHLFLYTSAVLAG